MTPAEVRALYAKIVAYDNRRPSDANLAAWAEQAEAGHWTLQEALDAVREHHRGSREFLMPIHVHEIIRSNRRQPSPYVAIEGPPPADETTRERVMAMVRGAFDMPGRMRRDRADKSQQRPRMLRAQPKSAEHAHRRQLAEAELQRVREQQAAT